MMNENVQGKRSFAKLVLNLDNVQNIIEQNDVPKQYLTAMVWRWGGEGFGVTTFPSTP